MLLTGSAACPIKFDSSKSCAQIACVPNISMKSASAIKDRSCLLLLMTILFLFCPLTRGQELDGTFTGTVTDSSGAVISHATITITLNGVSGSSRVVQSNNIGNFTATNLSAGTYTITISNPGFEKYSDRNVVLNVAQKRTIRHVYPSVYVTLSSTEMIGNR